MTVKTGWIAAVLVGVAALAAAQTPPAAGGKPAAGQWTPRGAGDVWSVSWSDPRTRAYQVTIENQDQPLTNLRIVQSTLHDTTGHFVGGAQLSLRERVDGPATDPIAVAANSVTPVFILIDQGSRTGPFGSFDGAIRLAADGSSTTRDITLKLQATSDGIRALGIALTAAGLLLAWVVTARLRPEVARLQFMRPVAALRQQVARFRAEIDDVRGNVPCPNLQLNAQRLEDGLDETALQGAGLIPLFELGVEGGTDSAAALKAYLEKSSAKLSGLMILLRGGVARLLPRLATDRQDTLDRIGRIDAAADIVTNEQTARDAIQPALAPAGGREAGFRLSEESPTTVREIDFAIRHVANVTALIWCVLSLAIGAAWIVSKADYGTPIDLVSSFLWGFGLTSFGAGIQNLTPTSVGTQLSVKLPK